MLLIKEVIFVGIITAIFGFLISTGLMFFNKDFKLAEYHFWPQVMLGYFITGMIIHILFEMLGFNKWYCKNGNACLN